MKFKWSKYQKMNQTLIKGIVSHGMGSSRAARLSRHAFKNLEDKLGSFMDISDEKLLYLLELEVFEIMKERTNLHTR